MTNHEAMMILRAYRPGGQDASDPQFAEALEQARLDPTLEKWFAEERATDASIQAKLLAATPVPPDLKANLLALRNVVRPTAWWRKPVWLAAAAAVVLLAALSGIWLTRLNAPKYADLRNLTIQTSRQERLNLDFHSQNISEIKDWLKTQHVPVDFEVPSSLAGVPVHGCKIIDWEGRKVTLLCFMPNGDSHLALFVIDCTHFRDFKPSETPELGRSDGVSVAVWCQQDKTYLLAGAVGEEQLRKLL